MKHFKIEEFCKSATADRMGIKIVPDAAETKALEALVENVLDPLREKLGKPVSVTSGLRPKKVNIAVGGTGTSQHVKGEAADIQVKGMSPIELCRFIVAEGLPFDQLIEEGTWTHVSYGPRNRRQVLTMRNGKYTNGLRS